LSKKKANEEATSPARGKRNRNQSLAAESIRRFSRTPPNEDVLAGLLEVRETLPELGKRSREYVERVHAHTSVARRVLEIYERVMPISS